MSGSWPPEDFPHLEASNHNVTSVATREYNCLAWAADETNRRWEPDSMNQHYWPPSAPREVTMDAFIEAYRTLGYEVCDTPQQENGFEKIALYADSEESPTHAAKQLPNGNWTSKLGDFEDIEHPILDSLNGELYGRPVTYLRRPRPAAT